MVEAEKHVLAELDNISMNQIDLIGDVHVIDITVLANWMEDDSLSECVLSRIVLNLVCYIALRIFDSFPRNDNVGFQLRSLSADKRVTLAQGVDDDLS